MSQSCQPRLPLEPLMAVTGTDRATTATPQRDGRHYRGEVVYEQPSPTSSLAQLIGTSRRTVCRWVTAGIPLRAAEDACDALSLHPCEVWGDEWIDACLGSA